MNGIVKEYDKQRWYGFITEDDGQDYFVHAYGLGSKLKSSVNSIGQRVVFDFDMKGDKAINVRPL